MNAHTAGFPTPQKHIHPQVSKSPWTSPVQTQARRQARDAQGLALTYVMSSSVSRAPVVMPMIWVQFCMMTGARRSAKVPVGLLHTGRLSWLGELHLLEAGGGKQQRKRQVGVYTM